MHVYCCTSHNGQVLLSGPIDTENAVPVQNGVYAVFKYENYVICKNGAKTIMFPEASRFPEEKYLFSFS